MKVASKRGGIAACSWLGYMFIWNIFQRDKTAPYMFKKIRFYLVSQHLQFNSGRKKVLSLSNQLQKLHLYILAKIKFYRSTTANSSVYILEKNDKRFYTCHSSYNSILSSEDNDYHIRLLHIKAATNDVKLVQFIDKNCCRKSSLISVPHR